MMNIQISLDNTGDHPLYLLQLLTKDGKYRIEQSLRFAACRDFHQEFVVPCAVKLEAVFPVTKKRSSLGIKLSEDLLLGRTAALNTYMREVLARFLECPPPLQTAFIGLLSASSVPLSYFRGEVSEDPRPPPASSSDSKDVHLTMNVTTTKASHQRSNNSNVIITHKASELEEIRISQLRTQMTIQVTLINTGDHPLYKLQLSSKDNIYNVEHTMRFAQYRDFQQSVMEQCSLKMLSEFPDTKTRSSLGLKLGDEELLERASKLNKYLTEVVTRFVDLPIDTKLALISFLKAEYIPALYFNNDPQASSESRASSKESRSLSQKLIKQMSHLSGRGVAEGAVERKRPPLVIQVSRTSSEGSVKFDVLVRLTTSDDKQILVCSRPFKEFRQLREEILANLEDIQNTKHSVIPEFPPTFRRSSFGLSLSEMEVVQRVRSLDEWVRTIAKLYPVLSNRSQLFIFHFFNLDCLVAHESYEKPIQEQLKAGNVFREQDQDASLASLQYSSDTAGGGDGKGQYSAVELPPPPPGDALPGEEEEGGWTVIGAKKGDPPPPKGCCVLS